MRVNDALRGLPVLPIAVATLAGGVFTDDDYCRLWATTPDVSSLFNADRWIAIETARRLTAETNVPLSVAAGDADQPLQCYLRDGDPVAPHLRLFDGTRSLILPPDGQPATHVFATRDLPPTSLRQRFFPTQAGQPIATMPDGQPIELYRLPVGTVLVPERQVLVRFGNDLQVIGFDLPRDATAGGALTIRRSWRLLATDPRELAVFNPLVDARGQRRGQTDDRALAPGAWPPGTRGTTTFDVVIDPTAETGADWLDVGVDERESLTRLTAFDRQGRDAGGRVRLGPIKVHGRVAPTPTPEIPQQARLADQIGFLGYGLDRTRIAPGERLVVTLHWTARGWPSHDLLHAPAGFRRKDPGSERCTAGRRPVPDVGLGQRRGDRRPSHAQTRDECAGRSASDIGSRSECTRPIRGSGYQFGDHLLLRTTLIVT
ncbi:MAG TPA: hypothetical protein VKY56_08300 [Chloroflexota bacterium]|nr:hypothetical protein [Chloroflexota bacterium]